MYLKDLNKHKDKIFLAAFLAPTKTRRKLTLLYAYLLWEELDPQEKKKITNGTVKYSLIVLFVLFVIGFIN